MTKNMIHTGLYSATLIACAALVGGCCSSGKQGGGGYYGTSAASSGTGAASAAQATSETPAPGAGETAQAGNELVIPLYEEKLNVGKQEVDAGTVHLRKKVTTETVNQPVELKQETLNITRAPAGSAPGGTNQAQPFQEQNFAIQLHREEPMLQKQVVQSGTVVAQRQEQTQQRTVQSQVRREDVAVDKGTAQNVHISENIGSAASPGGESRGGAAATPASGTITDLTTLTQATDARSLSGRPVQLSNMQVQEVVNPHLIAIGTEQSPIYAYMQQPVENLKVGDKINLTGTVKAPSTATEATAAMGADVSQKLSSQPLFINAQSAQLSNE